MSNEVEPNNIKKGDFEGAFDALARYLFDEYKHFKNQQLIDSKEKESWID